MDRKKVIEIDHAADAALVLFAFLLAVLLASCGGASVETRTLYSLESARCVANERAIIDTEYESVESAQAAWEAERARCDAALHQIESAN